VRDVSRAWRRLAVVGGLAALAAVMAPSGAASAHAELVESSPASGAHLLESPTDLTLRFSEPVELLDDPIVLLDADGGQVDVGEAVAGGVLVTVALPDLADAAYVVDWQVVSSDGHPVTGAFTFTVGDATPIDPGSIGGSDGTSSSGSVSLAVWRALTYAGFAVVLGAWAFVLTCWPDGRRDRVVLLVITLGAAVALVATALRAVTEASVLDVSLGDLLDLRSGRAWLALVVLAALALGVDPLLRSRLRPGPLAGIWVAGAAAVGVAIAYAGHGASGRAPLGGTALTVIHVAAASVWVGGLVALVRCVVAVDRPTAWGVAARFSGLALGLVAALAVTGAVQGIRQLDSWDALTGSDFGRALLVKLAFVAVLLTVAWLSRLAVRRSAEPATATVAAVRLRRMVGTELVLAAAVLGVTGWLAGASPIASAEPSGPVTVTAPDTTGVATASATIAPAAVGPNAIHATISDPEGRSPDEVSMQLVPADGQVAAIDVPSYLMPGMVMSDRVDIPYGGDWTLTIDARYGDFELLTFALPFTVN
jgi:copper transport protein